MNFCVAILILKMEENKQQVQHIMLYYFRKSRKVQLKCRRRLVRCAEKVLGLIDCVKVLATFPAGDPSLGGAPGSGGAAVEAVSDPTGTLTENSQRSTTQEIDILKISKSIKLLVKMKFLSFILQEKLNILANPIFTREKQNYVHMK